MADPRLDQNRKTVTVLCLGTGLEMVYGDKSVRQALALAAIQDGRGDYNTWEYEDQALELGRQVSVGPSGRTANLAAFAKTFSTKLPAAPLLDLRPHVAVELDGRLAVRSSMADYSEPLLVRNYYPTTLSWADWKAFGLADEELGYERGVGFYYVWPDGVHNAPLRLDMPQGVDTKSVKVEKIPVPKPRCRSEIRWQYGRWQKRLTRGWVDA